MARKIVSIYTNLNGYVQRYEKYNLEILFVSETPIFILMLFSWVME